MLDKIEVKLQKTKFVVEEYLTIFINGIQLDVLLNEQYPDHYYLGLVPAFLDWFEEPFGEKKVVWERTTKTTGKTILPILVCPDDFDLWCTVIVAEVEITDSTINWNRLGADRTDAKLLIESLDNIGHDVEWFSKIKQFSFDKTEYLNCINMFKQQME